MNARLFCASKIRSPKRLSWLVKFPRRLASDILLLDVILAVASIVSIAIVGSTSAIGSQFIADSLGSTWTVALVMTVVAAICLLRLAYAQWRMHRPPWEEGRAGDTGK